MAVTTTNLGVITAYGDAVAAGYTGTKAEWQALMASYATVGQQAVDAKNATVDAKNAAVQAKDTAVAAKDTATSKATEATTAANTATTKANEASASAQSIAQSAAQIQENTDDIESLMSELEVTSSYNIAWSQGGINNSGTAVSRTNRIRTDYITIENDSIFVEIPSGFKYAIHAYNASKTRIGYIPNGSDIITERKATYKVSDSYPNAVYFRMWVAYADDTDILPSEGARVTVAPYETVIDTLKSHVLKSARILGVGNSYTRDSIRWLCKILKESGYEDVVVGHGYLGASTLAEQYATLDSSDSNHSAFEYWKYSNTKNAVKTSGKTLDEIFADEPWDIVVFQQQSDESGQYASYVSSSFDINDFITYISGKVSNADVKYGLMMPWSHADGYTSTKFAEYYNSDPEAMLDAIKSVIPQVADHMSQCDYVVNAGEAIDLGRQNSYLNALGDQMLRTDKNHLYYGIPSYMVGLVYALTLCDVNLNNVMWYPTATDEGQTGITTSGYLAYLAKQCAFTAVNGYALADDISELKEDLGYTKLSNFVPDAGTLGATGNWTQVASTTYKHIVIPIKPSDSVVITANNNFYTRIGFLRTYTKPTANGVPIDYSESTGFTGRILVAKGTSWTGSAPSDAHYISIDTLDAGDNEMPSYVGVNGIDYTSTIFGIIENINAEVEENKYILFDVIDFSMEWESGTFTTTVGSASANANSVYRQRTTAYLKNDIKSILHTDGTFYTNLVLYNDQMLVTSVTGYSVTDKVIPKDTYYRVLIADATSMETDISGYTSAQIKAKITAQNTEFYDMINPDVNWCSMGDSIAEGFVSYLGDNDEPTYKVDIDKAWVYKVARTNHWNLTNIAVGGTGWIDWKNNTSTVADGSPAWYVASQTDFTPYNLVTLAYGINDWKANEAIGTINDDPAVMTPTTVIQAMKKTIEAIIASNPHCKIIVILPLNCAGYSFNYGDETTNYALGYEFSNSGTLEQFTQALISVCDYYGIQYIDQTHYSCINRENLLSCLTDGVHPNADTHDLLARELCKKINFG